jgi:hypothetical protein
VDAPNLTGYPFLARFALLHMRCRAELLHMRCRAELLHMRCRAELLHMRCRAKHPEKHPRGPDGGGRLPRERALAQMGYFLVMLTVAER